MAAGFGFKLLPVAGIVLYVIVLLTLPTSRPRPQ
jgi:hypothetical protein